MQRYFTVLYGQAQCHPGDFAKLQAGGGVSGFRILLAWWGDAVNREAARQRTRHPRSTGKKLRDVKVRTREPP